MQSFCFFGSRLRHSFQSQKKWGATLRARFAGGKALQTIKKIKILLFFFPPYAVRTSSKNPKVQVKKVILTIFYILNIKSKTIQIFISWVLKQVIYSIKILLLKIFIIYNAAINQIRTIYAKWSSWK